MRPDPCAQDALSLTRRDAAIDTGISARGRHRQPAQIMRPTPVVVGALSLVRKTAMGHAQQSAAVPVDKIDLDQARSRWHLLPSLPTEAVGEAVDRHDLAEYAARHVSADAPQSSPRRPSSSRYLPDRSGRRKPWRAGLRSGSRVEPRADQSSMSPRRGPRRESQLSEDSS